MRSKGGLLAACSFYSYIHHMHSLTRNAMANNTIVATCVDEHLQLQISQPVLERGSVLF